ncbi:hypothetical protein NOCA2540040 [metagenome]|uniref:Uncharacterized protein n=1 Tax=metagenome TaxID=256318 RepID=A0A2P2C9U7_9ZZZZ
MHISIHLVARLFRVPILRVDGQVALTEREGLRSSAVSGPTPLAAGEQPVGRLLALAEAELAEADRTRMLWRG